MSSKKSAIKQLQSAFDEYTADARERGKLESELFTKRRELEQVTNSTIGNPAELARKAQNLQAEIQRLETESEIHRARIPEQKARLWELQALATAETNEQESAHADERAKQAQALLESEDMQKAVKVMQAYCATQYSGFGALHKCFGLYGPQSTPGRAEMVEAAQKHGLSLEAYERPHILQEITDAIGLPPVESKRGISRVTQQNPSIRNVAA